MASFLRTLLQRFRGRSYLVGRDFEGNRYYEHPSVNNDPRPRRTVKYGGSQDMHKYIGGQQRLAVQWSSWLTHTRADPPTLEELQADMIRQERIRRNVAILEARDSPQIVESAPPLSLPRESGPPPLELPKPAVQPAATSEPEAWTPQASSRGS